MQIFRADNFQSPSTEAKYRSAQCTQMFVLLLQQYSKDYNSSTQQINLPVKLLDFHLMQVQQLCLFCQQCNQSSCKHSKPLQKSQRAYQTISHSTANISLSAKSHSLLVGCRKLLKASQPFTYQSFIQFSLMNMVTGQLVDTDCGHKVTYRIISIIYV